MTKSPLPHFMVGPTGRAPSLQYSRAFSELYFRWLPNFKADKFHHDISHLANDPRIGTIQQWYQARFSELLQMFKDTSEYGGRMLDNMLVVNAMEMHTPWNHDCANRQPNWIAGKLGGIIPRTGRLLDYGGKNDHNQFLVTILHALRPHRRHHHRQSRLPAGQAAQRARLAGSIG